VVVPVWRDAAALDRLLAGHASSAVQWVVARCDEDEEAALLDALEARHPEVCWVRSERGRGPQQNAGAAAAEGDWLLFLHADTMLPSGWRDEIVGRAGRRGHAWGCFRFSLATDAWQARLIEWGVAGRVRLFSLPYGDQGIFVRRDVFQSAGGFPASPLMEDVALVRRLRRFGRPYRSALRARTSARRWQQDGWWRRTWINLSVLARYAAGVPPERLVRPYERPQR
jgi:rSAM/selenodomain-associated transferase 2